MQNALLKNLISSFLNSFSPRTLNSVCMFTLMSYEHLCFNGPLILLELEVSAFLKQEMLQVGHISSYTKHLHGLR